METCSGGSATGWQSCRKKKKYFFFQPPPDPSPLLFPAVTSEGEGSQIYRVASAHLSPPLRLSPICRWLCLAKQIKRIKAAPHLPPADWCLLHIISFQGGGGGGGAGGWGVGLISGHFPKARRPDLMALCWRLKPFNYLYLPHGKKIRPSSGSDPRGTESRRAKAFSISSSHEKTKKARWGDGRGGLISREVGNFVIPCDICDTVF